MARLSFRALRCLKLQIYHQKGCTYCKANWSQHYRKYSTRGPNGDVLQQLVNRIRAGGPITVASYMKEVLTNPVSGYYMHRDVFGTQGDFITSPEISQMFGELIGVWGVNEWLECGSPPHLQVVELGPGRGTLADDMLRVFSQFPQVKDKVSLHLVEVSPKMSEMQEIKLTGGSPSNTNPDIDRCDQDTTVGVHYKQCRARHGPPVYWHQTLGDVPKGFSFYVAHEFLDALPIHKFQKSGRGWSEVLIDIDEDSSSGNQLRFVLSPGPTMASTAYLQVDATDKREHIEVCPGAGVIVQELATRIKQDGGFALIADYGHNGQKTDTFRGFRNHKLHDVLSDPGTADLTADVDFSYLARMVAGQVSTYGPIEQAKFLHNMGIGLRLKVLYEKASPAGRKDLLSGYEMLTYPDKMGERFKFFTLHQQQTETYKPAGYGGHQNQQ